MTKLKLQLMMKKKTLQMMKVKQKLLKLKQMLGEGEDLLKKFLKKIDKEWNI